MRLSGGWSSTTRSPWSRGTAHHIPQHQVEGCCGRGEEEFARGKHPGGVVLFKNSERMFWKVKVESESEMSEDHLFVFE